MIGPDATHPPRLSECSLRTEYSIPTRDINPRELTGGNYPLQTPARSTIVVVDRDGGGNAGVFVSIRVDMADIPQAIKQRLETLNIIPGDARFENIDTSKGGSIHIGYSHIASGTIPLDIEPVDIRIGDIPEGVKTPAGTIIGYSGDTGAAFGTHLDIAVFYVPDDPSRANAIIYESYGDPYFLDFRHNWEAFWTMYDETKRKLNFGKPIVVNPLVLWPILQEGTTCSFEG